MRRITGQSDQPESFGWPGRCRSTGRDRVSGVGWVGIALAHQRATLVATRTGLRAGGILSVRLTDSPYEAAGAVLVTIPEISVHRSGDGWVTVSDDELVCDLKQLENGTDTSVGEVELTAGHYTQIRLIVLAAALYQNPAVDGTDPCDAIPSDDLFVPMNVPSGTIRLTRQFTVAADGLTTISLDFDGDRSIRQIGNRSGNSNGNGNGNNGNGNSGGDEEEEKGELDLDGRYQMHPVIKILSVEEQESPE